MFSHVLLKNYRFYPLIKAGVNLFMIGYLLKIIILLTIQNKKFIRLNSIQFSNTFHNLTFNLSTNQSRLDKNRSNGFHSKFNCLFYH